MSIRSTFFAKKVTEKCLISKSRDALASPCPLFRHPWLEQSGIRYKCCDHGRQKDFFQVRDNSGFFPKPKKISRGCLKVMKFHFTHSKLRKHLFLLNIVQEDIKCQNSGDANPPVPFRRPWLCLPLNYLNLIHTHNQPWDVTIRTDDKGGMTYREDVLV